MSLESSRWHTRGYFKYVKVLRDKTEESLWSDFFVLRGETE